MSTIGASFWIVDRINTWGHLSPSMTWGNHQWKGAPPTFKRRARKIVTLLINESDKYKNLEEISITDPRAWIRKYFKEASEYSGFIFNAIKGMKDIRFSSSPTHAPNQEDDDAEIIDPDIKVKRKNK